MEAALRVKAVALLVLVPLAACSDQATLDERATALRERLGSLCEAFDFQTKKEANQAVYRAVDCKTDQGVVLRILVFQDLEHLRDSWRDVADAKEAVPSGPPGPHGIGVQDEAATVIVYDRSLIEDVQERLAQ